MLIDRSGIKKMLFCFSCGGARVHGRDSERDGAGWPQCPASMLRQEPWLLQGTYLRTHTLFFN